MSIGIISGTVDVADDVEESISVSTIVESHLRELLENYISESVTEEARIAGIIVLPSLPGKYAFRANLTYDGPEEDEFGPHWLQALKSTINVASSGIKIVEARPDAPRY